MDGLKYPVWIKAALNPVPGIKSLAPEFASAFESGASKILPRVFSTATKAAPKAVPRAVPLPKPAPPNLGTPPKLPTPPVAPTLPKPSVAPPLPAPTPVAPPVPAPTAPSLPVPPRGLIQRFSETGLVSSPMKAVGQGLDTLGSRVKAPFVPVPESSPLRNFLGGSLQAAGKGVKALGTTEMPAWTGALGRGWLGRRASNLLPANMADTAANVVTTKGVFQNMLGGGRPGFARATGYAMAGSALPAAGQWARGEPVTKNWIDPGALMQKPIDLGISTYNFGRSLFGGGEPSDSRFSDPVSYAAGNVRDLGSIASTAWQARNNRFARDRIVDAPGVLGGAVGQFASDRAGRSGLDIGGGELQLQKNQEASKAVDQQLVGLSPSHPEYGKLEMEQARLADERAALEMQRPASKAILDVSKTNDQRVVERKPDNRPSEAAAIKRIEDRQFHQGAQPAPAPAAPPGEAPAVAPAATPPADLKPMTPDEYKQTSTRLEEIQTTANTVFPALEAKMKAAGVSDPDEAVAKGVITPQERAQVDSLVKEHMELGSRKALHDASVLAKKTLTPADMQQGISGNDPRNPVTNIGLANAQKDLQSLMGGEVTPRNALMVWRGLEDWQKGAMVAGLGLSVVSMVAGMSTGNPILGVLGALFGGVVAAGGLSGGDIPSLGSKDFWGDTAARGFQQTHSAVLPQLTGLADPSDGPPEHASPPPAEVPAVSPGVGAALLKIQPAYNAARASGDYSSVAQSIRSVADRDPQLGGLIKSALRFANNKQIRLRVMQELHMPPGTSETEYIKLIQALRRSMA